MNEVDSRGADEAEKLAADFDWRAQILRRASARVRDGTASTVLSALCEEVLNERDGDSAAVIVEAEQLAAAVSDAFNDMRASVRYLVAARPRALSGFTPLEVIARGEVFLLLRSLTAIQHGLGA